MSGSSAQLSTISLARRVRAWLLLAFAALCTSCPALAQTGIETCGDPRFNHFGPWDFRQAPKEHLDNVQRHHFTASVEAMTRGVTTGRDTIAGDVAYTLGVFPNHHRALLTMMRLSERHRADPPPGTMRTVECWYDRAVRFAPDDTVVRMLYAQFLAKRSRKGEALAQLQAAEEVGANNPLTQFNVGMSYFELGDYERALKAAHRARALGWPRTELEERLKASDKWSPPQ